jgi:hypothetical protein
MKKQNSKNGNASEAVQGTETSLEDRLLRRQ